MTRKFRKFLKNNNAYDKYVKNNNGESENPYTFFEGFIWMNTPEGYEYWLELDDKWGDCFDLEHLGIGELK